MIDLLFIASGGLVMLTVWMLVGGILSLFDKYVWPLGEDD